MRVETLPSPGILSSALRLRIEAAKAISAVEIVAGRTPGGKTKAAYNLSAFFTACADALSALVDGTAPTMAGTTITSTAATTNKIAFGETMDQTVTPAAAAFAVDNGGVVSSVAWGSGGDAGKLILTGTGFAALDVVTYTQPATNFLRDRAGNAMASGTKATV